MTFVKRIEEGEDSTAAVIGWKYYRGHFGLSLSWNNVLLFKRWII